MVVEARALRVLLAGRRARVRTVNLRHANADQQAAVASCLGLFILRLHPSRLMPTQQCADSLSAHLSLKDHCWIYARLPVKQV